MTRQLFLVAVVALSAAPLAADEGLVPDEEGDRPASVSTTEVESPVADANATRAGNDYYRDPWGDDLYPGSIAARFGWWATSNDGEPNKVGEFQDLDPSPFWDVDSILSNGERTLDFTLSGLDQEANDARLRYYATDVWAKLNYERFLRRLDHDPLTGTPFPPGTPYPPGDPGLPGDVGNVRTQDLNIGEDYAIRVEEFDAKFGARLSDNVKWRLNVWGMRKFGERQVNATAHCFNTNIPAAAGANGNTCHVLSQRQTIDWTTTEIQPAVEARFGPATVEYSRTMRIFEQNDQLVGRTYTRFGFNAPAASGFEGPPYDYAVVPESFTQIDRLKVGAALNERNQFYANLYLGDTKQQFRDMHREFRGVDVRLTNRSIDRVTLTSYASIDDETTDFPPFFLNAPPLAPAPTAPGTPSYDESSVLQSVDRTRTRAGVKGQWRPFSGSYSSECVDDLWSGFSMTGGYEFYRLSRDFATYETALGPFTQPDTVTNQITFGPTMRWSQGLETYVRYKGRFIDVPLIGVREHNGLFNTNQPEQEHGVEIGETWTPVSNFMATAQVGLINRWHDSQFAQFTEDDYPVVCTLWYAPFERLSLSAGYAYFSNWIDQDITLGFTLPTIPVPPLRTETTPWDYGGTNHLVSIGANYAWTPCVHLIGGFEWNRGHNVFSVPASPAGADWSLLPSLSDVLVETTRMSGGIDYLISQNVSCYFRYIFFDYEDKSENFNSGTTHMFLGGFLAMF